VVSIGFSTRKPKNLSPKSQFVLALKMSGEYSILTPAMKQSSECPVSVVMPVWNGGEFLVQAIDSILGQTLKTFEFLILDDGSTDSTPDILNHYEKLDSRVRTIRLNHEGIVAALNRGVAEASSEWIARMDADDIADPRRLEFQMRAIARNPNAVLCYSGVKKLVQNSLVRDQRVPRTKQMLLVRMCIACAVVHPTVVFNKTAFLQAGGYFPHERHAEDYGLWLRLLPLGDTIAIPQPLLMFRTHEKSISKVASEIQRKVFESIRMEFQKGLFGSDWENVNTMLTALKREKKCKLDLKNALSLASMLNKANLLNIETLAWAAWKTLR
jgi:glycosyltransferase involved in cell wall biosynthesis